MHNFKLIEYPNGTCQLRKYFTPIGSKEPKKQTRIEVKKQINTEIEPFTNTEAKVVKEFSDTKENQRKSLAHTKNMIFYYARCCKWEWFCTFTFSPEKIDRYNFSLCMNKIRNWLKNQKNRHAPDLKYLVVPETHKDGAWHLHVLLADTGDMVFTDSGKKQREHIIYNLSGWKWGFSTATKVIDTYRIQSYIAKYITKESYVLAKNAHRYYVSQNLPKAKESMFLVEATKEKEFLENLMDSLGVEIKHSSIVESKFVSVQYMELR